VGIRQRLHITLHRIMVVLGVFPLQVPCDTGCERVHALVTGVTCESEDVLMS
jgi:hypothetical protein